MTTIREALQQAAARLTSASPSARLDAEVLLGHLLHVSRTTLLADSQRPLDVFELAAYDQLVARREALEPVAYLVGHKEFYGFDFLVDHRVLVPRPETELVIERTLEWASRRAIRVRTVADIGTGSGCLAITLALLLPNADIYAVDLSPAALAVAKLNARRHNVEQRVMLLQGSGCEPLPNAVELIVSNPPYTVLADVDENVHRWEPHLALDGGAEQGFAIPAQILGQARDFLLPEGAMFMEFGAWQGRRALEAAQALFPEARISIYQDLAGLDRVIAIET